MPDPRPYNWLFFCFFLRYSHFPVFEPRSIRCQFTYQLWIMMKMFLSAVATGLLCLATLSVLPFTKNAFENARIEYLGCLTTKGVLMASIGGALLGAGMALSGAVSVTSVKPQSFPRLPLGAGCERRAIRLGGETNLYQSLFAYTYVTWQSSQLN